MLTDTCGKMTTGFANVASITASTSKAQQYQILKAKATKALGTSWLNIPELRVLVLTKRHVGSQNEIGPKKWRADSGQACELFASKISDRSHT